MPNIIEINNFNIPELNIYARLTEVQLLHLYEPKNGIFIAESPKVIERALDAGYVPVSILVEKKHVDGQAHDIISRCGETPVYTADFDILTQLTGYKLTRGMLCAMRRHALPNVENICASAGRIAVLENVVNPTNIGAIFRSAAALNIDAVLLTPACSDPLYRRAIRVSMGTVFQVPWTYLGKHYDTSHDSSEKEQPESGIEYLKRLGFKTAAMALTDNSINIADPILASEEKLAIVLGAEGDGLAPCTIAECDYTIRIPMSHGVDSLNVAAASAVAFWQLRRPPF